MADPQIIVVCGPMFAQKSSYGMLWAKKHKRTDYFKVTHNVEGITPSTIYSHDNQVIPGYLIPPDEFVQDALDQADIHRVVIDEIHFIPIDHLKKMVLCISKLGVSQMLIGCDMDFEGNVFEQVAWACGYASQVIKLSATCTECSKEARFTKRRGGNKDRVVEDTVGGLYSPACFNCFYGLNEEVGGEIV